MDSAEVPCRSSDPDLWFSSVRSELSTAIALCRICSHLHQCLTGALDRQEAAGIWGVADISSRGGKLRPFRGGRHAATPPDDSGFMPLRNRLRDLRTKGSVLVKH